MVKPPDKAADKVGPSDSDELSAWMAMYGPALQRFFARKAGAPHAEDLVQEVFLRLQARADRAPTENVEGLLFTVAKRVLIDRYRSNAAHAVMLHDPVDAADQQPDELSPERIVAARQAYARAIVAIDALPERMQTVFMLHRFGKLSYSAISKRIGISKTMVHKLMNQAIARVMNSLEGWP